MNARSRVRHWLFDRCSQCGHRFAWRGDARHSSGDRDGKVFHGPCLAYRHWRSRADERLQILALVVDVTEVTHRDLTVIAELRAADEDQRVADSNRVFRVFHDLEKARP